MSTGECTICGSMTLPCTCPYLKNVAYPAPSQRLQQRITELETELIKTRDALKQAKDDILSDHLEAVARIDSAIAKINEVLL